MKTQSKDFDNFCANIRRLRLINGLGEKEMAKRLGIGLPTLRKLEEGIVPPRLLCDVLGNIYQAFGISPSRIFLPEDESGAP